MYPSILSFETLNKVKLLFECGNPMPQDAGTPLLAQLQFFLPRFIILIAVLENMPPDAGLQKRAIFSTLNVGLTGNLGELVLFCATWIAAEKFLTAPSNSPTFLTCKDFPPNKVAGSTCLT
jgi:hypothetical protein